MSKLTLHLLAVLCFVCLAAAIYKGWQEYSEKGAARRLTETIETFASLTAAAETEKAYAMAHPVFQDQQSYDEFDWYAQWLVNQLGPCKAVKLEKTTPDFTVRPGAGAADLVIEYEKTVCKARVAATDVGGNWRIQSFRVEIPSLVGEFACPECGTTGILRRICTRCGRQLMSVPGRPLLPESPPDPPVDPALLADYATIDPAAEWRGRLYLQKDFDALGDHLQELLSRCDSELGAYQYTRFCAALTKLRDRTLDDMLPALDEWAEKEPASHFPLLLKGYLLTHAAWKVRGPGWNQEVNPENMAVFVKLLKDAATALAPAREMNGVDPEPPSLMMSVAKGLTLPRGAMEQLYAEAVKRSPANFAARVRKFEYLTPKWCGSWEELHEFATQCAQDAEKYPMAGLIPAYERAEMHFRSKFYRYMRNKKRWNSYKQAYEKVFEQYPDLLEHRIDLAYLAYYANDLQAAAEQFNQIANRWTDNYYWPDLATFHRFKAITLAYSALAAPAEKRLQLAREALAIAPDEPYPHFVLGKVLAEAGPSEEALEHFKIATEKAPLYAEALVNLAWLSGGYMNYAQAYRAAERALLLRLQDDLRPDALRYLNVSLQKMGPPSGLILAAPAGA